jgi:hypothetical protein
MISPPIKLATIITTMIVVERLGFFVCGICV